MGLIAILGLDEYEYEYLPPRRTEYEKKHLVALGQCESIER